MSYFKDFTNAEVGKEIERLCQLADLKLPELPKETAEFIKDEFARVPKDVFRKSIDEYIAGSIEVEAYAKATLSFYVECYGHTLVSTDIRLRSNHTSM